MRLLDRFLKVMAVLSLVLLSAAPGEARGRKADKLYFEGKKAEIRQDWDKALDLFEKALSEDPSDAAYDLAAKRVRFQSAAAHLKAGPYDFCTIQVRPLFWC
jgi:hypothetical protein